MRYFLDTEFIEDGHTIDLISIGIVSEDGRELYFESHDCDLDKANPWVQENVIPHLRQVWTSRSVIRAAISNFIQQGMDKDALEPEFWGYYADYDWVALCQLYGTMMDLPMGWPMMCMDLKQLCVSVGDPELPKQETAEHNALADARWNRVVFLYLQEREL